MRHLLFPLALVFPLAPVQAAGLNDTGQTKCLNAAGTALEDCSAVNTGDVAAYPRQDARFGRDAAAAVLAKTGGGAAGFDFTKICNSGEAAGTGSCPANPSLGSGGAQWACTRDNVTDLIWEVKTDDNGLRDKDWSYRWGATEGGASCGNTLTPCNSNYYVTAVNAAKLCGFTDWRLPTRRELLSIVHVGTDNPAIDTAYFTNTVSDFYWSSDLYAPYPAYAWYVHFANGLVDAAFHGNDFRVRLVRSGQ